MKSAYRISGARARGISLVELMVGVVVALVAVIVIMQVFQLSEGQRRTTTGGDDAQTTGLIASTVLQKDLRQAGQSIVHPSLLACNLTLPNGRIINNLAGVAINHADIPAGDTGTDTLRVVYGTGTGSPEGSRIQAQPSNDVFAVAAPRSFALNNRVIATAENRPTPCAPTLTSVRVAPLGNNVTTSVGAAGMTNGVLHNLGQEAVTRAYRVVNGQLTVCDFLVQNCTQTAAANWTPIADGVVSLRAQYGEDTTVTMDGTVEQFTQTTPTTACGWYRRPAVRMVMVVRSGQLERDNVTTTAPTWAGTADAPISLSGLTNWQRFRYKTFETTVALRNIAWQGVIGGC